MSYRRYPYGYGPSPAMWEPAQGAEPAPSAWKPLQDAALASVALAVAGELGCLLAFGTADVTPFILAGEVAALPFAVVGAARLAVLIKRARADVARAGFEEPTIIEPDYFVEDNDNFHLVKVAGLPTPKARKLEDWRWAIDHAYNKGLSSRAWIGQRTPSGVAIDYERWRAMIGELARLGIVEGGGDRKAARLAVPKTAALEAFGFSGDGAT